MFHTIAGEGRTSSEVYGRELAEGLQRVGNGEIDLTHWTTSGRLRRAAAAVRPLARVARPKRVWADYTYVRGFTRSAARQLLEDAGLPVEAIWRMGAVPLSGRLHLIWLVPHLLRLPLFDELWAASWELRARK
jgi:hypothetical protein